MTKIYKDGVLMDMTAQEEADHTQTLADGVKDKAAADAAKVTAAQLATDKVSAKAKLIAGEALTEAEADALTG